MTHLAWHQLAAWGLFLGLPLAFLAIVLWVYRPGVARRYRADGRIPFLGEGRRQKGGPASGPPPAAKG